MYVLYAHPTIIALAACSLLYDLKEKRRQLSLERRHRSDLEKEARGLGL